MSQGNANQVTRRQHKDSFRRPAYIAYELDEPDIFRCYEYGPMLATAKTLRAWARQIGVDLILFWRRGVL